MALFDQISKDIVAAMKAKDKIRLEALRNIKKYFIEAKTAPGANDELSDDAALKILAKLVKQGRDTAALYTEQQRPDLAEAELAQVAVIEAYLPKALTPEELEAALAQHHCRNGRHIGQGNGQGDGRGHQAPGRPRRRQSHLDLGAPTAGLSRAARPQLAIRHLTNREETPVSPRFVVVGRASPKKAA